ncbi:hypothetical protein BOTBODRAFT_33608 [Botryobasidium botryosum FD-172 SS1]|uniref:Tyrosinase copper-binding domain-containing protein n=1 Tax=Botryobasidium botryosum (strain FD-172 SS1) TaxID=930990 RepID=A0A067MC03_BOTB1|nr:hypothetical protein BOTBODRAFT_33608 [Botryobasidium botryosum FD-172 SS1]
MSCARAPTLLAIYAMLSLQFVILACALGSTVAIPSKPTCQNPGVRKEWRALGYSGQKAYVDAMKCLSSLPHDPSLSPTGATPGLPPLDKNSSRYDDVVYTHMDANEKVHFTGRFYPFHRYFVHTVEDILQKKCQYKGYIPYWDWTLGDYADIKNSPIFSADPVVGLGAFPDASTNFTLTTGAFRNWVRKYPIAHPIQRNYTLQPFKQQIFPWSFNLPDKRANETQTPAEWQSIVTGYVGNFTAFQGAVDGVRAEGVHASTHRSLGGDVADPSWSPNDPLFFLVHAQLDRLWATWQKQHPANQYAIGGGEDLETVNIDQFLTGSGKPVTADTTIYLSNLGPDVKIKDLLSTKGGVLCYDYAT